MYQPKWAIGLGQLFAAAACLAAASMDCSIAARADAAADASAAGKTTISGSPMLPTDNANAPATLAPSTATIATPNVGSAQPTSLSEVVVTATKRSKSVREIPASITSISGDELEQRNAQGVQDIVKLVPGVNFTTPSGSPPLITIRGISAQPATGFTSGTLFGDVSFTDEYVPLVALDPNPFDLKDVEVLKGPQGTLFGGSALNGAIRYVPEAPRYSIWQTRYFAEGMQYSGGGLAPSYGAMVNVPMAGDSLALRLVGFEHTTPGYIDNTRTHTRDSNRVSQEGFRGILGWQPIDPLEVKLTYAWQNTHTADRSQVGNYNGDLSNTDSPQASPNHQNYDLVELALRYHLDWADAVSDTAYVRKGSYSLFDQSERFEGLTSSLGIDGSIPILAAVSPAHSDYWSQEFRLTSPNQRNAPWQWVAGAFASRQLIFDALDGPLDTTALPTSTVAALLNALLPGLGGSSFGEQPNLLNVQSGVVVKEMALFGEITRKQGPFELTLGGRFYRTLSSGSNLQDGLILDALLASPSGQSYSGELNEAGINPKVSLLWHATNDIIAYTAASRGSRPGGIQPGTALPVIDPVQAPKFFVSDNIWSYEAGLRTNWLHRTVHFDITGYYERWKNPQYNQPDASGLISFISNVGGVKTVGAEAALQWLLPIKGLMISSSGSYNRTVTTKPFTGSTGSAVPVGSDWPFAPNWQDANTLAYLVELWSIDFNGGVTYSYLGKAVNGLVQQARVFGYEQWDAHLSLDSKDRPWLPELTLTVNNFTNRRGIVNQVFSTQPPEVYNEVTYIPPRLISLRLSGRF
jgi:outer membrane receptor protein involved in Fe transport